MKKLEHLALVQFSLYEDQDIPISGNTAFLGLNGCGKSTLLDAIQIVLTGATRLALNSQASATGHRTVRDYCLGVVQQDGGHGTALRLREIALSYIALTFRDEKTHVPISLGICISARADSPRHEVEGMFVLKGRKLMASDFIERIDKHSFRSLTWRDFEAAQRAGGNDPGVSFETAASGSARKYVALYLHHLQDSHRSIDVDRYLGTLKESLHLKRADDIDSFVRNHLIGPNPINIEQCSRQIRDFEELRAIVEEIERRLTELATLDQA